MTEESLMKSRVSESRLTRKRLIESKLTEDAEVIFVTLPVRCFANYGARQNSV